MCNMVVDANIFKAFYEEDTGHSSPRPERTGAAKDIFNFESVNANVFLDEGGQIEHEWKMQCLGGSEWFDAWLAENFSNGRLVLVDAKKYHQCAKTCHQKGFPAGSKDIWYIKTAYAARDSCVERDTLLISEDIDFYDPSKKSAKNKQKTILSGSGSMASLLLRERVEILCLHAYSKKTC